MFNRLLCYYLNNGPNHPSSARPRRAVFAGAGRRKGLVYAAASTTPGFSTNYVPTPWPLQPPSPPPPPLQCRSSSPAWMAWGGRTASARTMVESSPATATSTIETPSPFPSAASTQPRVSHSRTRRRLYKQACSVLSRRPAGFDGSFKQGGEVQQRVLTFRRQVDALLGEEGCLEE